MSLHSPASPAPFPLAPRVFWNSLWQISVKGHKSSVSPAALKCHSSDSFSWCWDTQTDRQTDSCQSSRHHKGHRKNRQSSHSSSQSSLEEGPGTKGTRAALELPCCWHWHFPSALSSRAQGRSSPLFAHQGTAMSGMSHAQVQGKAGHALVQLHPGDQHPRVDTALSKPSQAIP